jgi:hypothetical protein
VAIGNAGKQLVLFDKAQQARNKEFEFELSRREEMHIFTITLSKIISSIGTQVVKIDMLELLDGQEVLSFSIGDYTAEVHGRICVQAKDLCLYIIDYDQGKVIKKVSSNTLTVHTKSIFFDLGSVEANSEHFGPLKEKIEEEQRLGNEVKIPKKNDQVIIIR